MAEQTAKALAGSKDEQGPPLASAESFRISTFSDRRHPRTPSAQMHRFKTCNDFREARIPCVTPCCGHRNETSTPKGQLAQLQYPSGDNVRSPRGTLLAKPLISSRRQRPLPPYRRWCLMRRHCPRPRRPHFSAVRVGLASVSRFFGLLGGDGGFGLLRLWGVSATCGKQRCQSEDRSQASAYCVD